MKQTTTLYPIICQGCKETLCTVTPDYSRPNATDIIVKEILECNGWKEVKGNYFCPDCYLISQIGINRDTDDNKPDEYHDSVEEDYHSLIDDDYMEMWQRIRKENGDSII